jgi:hypothetical protein
MQYLKHIWHNQHFGGWLHTRLPSIFVIKLIDLISYYNVIGDG